MDRRPVGTLAGLHDGSVRHRIVDIGQAWLKDLPVIFPAGAGRKAAYRPLSNPGGPCGIS